MSRPELQYYVWRHYPQRYSISKTIQYFSSTDCMQFELVPRRPHLSFPTPAISYSNISYLSGLRSFSALLVLWPILSTWHLPQCVWGRGAVWVKLSECNCVDMAPDICHLQTIFVWPKSQAVHTNEQGYTHRETLFSIFIMSNIYLRQTAFE